MKNLIFIIVTCLSSSIIIAQNSWEPSSYHEIEINKRSTIFNDEFDNNINDWWLKDYGPQTGRIENGTYIISSYDRTKSIFRQIDIPIDVNFEIEILAKLTNNDQSFKNESAFGIIWGRHNYDKNQYSFGYNLAQKVNASKRSNASKFKFYIKNNINNKIDIEDFNKLTVRRVGGNYFLFINEQFIKTYKADPFFGNGIGFAVSNSMLIVDSYKIQELSKDGSFKLKSSEVSYEQKPVLASDQKKSKIIKEENLKSVPLKYVSDVDLNIPDTDFFDENAFALIIGNENYKQEILVPYALNDAAIFKIYAENILGVPANHIHFIRDATYGQLLGEVDWIKNVIKAYAGQAKVYFYYAGHGLPNDETKSSYLLPVDGYSSNFLTSIKLEDIYSSLSESPAQSVNIFLDACFSGGSRTGMLTTGRGVRIKPKKETISGNMIIFSATSGEETAHPYVEKSHGLFTYYLLKKLKETNGNTTWLELSDYVRKNVNKVSVVNNKLQTPNIIISPELMSLWKDRLIR